MIEVTSAEQVSYHKQKIPQLTSGDSAQSRWRCAKVMYNMRGYVDVKRQDFMFRLVARPHDVSLCLCKDSKTWIKTSALKRFCYQAF